MVHHNLVDFEVLVALDSLEVLEELVVLEVQHNCLQGFEVQLGMKVNWALLEEEIGCTHEWWYIEVPLEVLEWYSLVVQVVRQQGMEVQVR